MLTISTIAESDQQTIAQVHFEGETGSHGMPFLPEMKFVRLPKPWEDSEITQEDLKGNVPWDCYDGLIVVGSFNVVRDTFNKWKEFALNHIEEPVVTDDLDESGIPHHFALFKIDDVGFAVADGYLEEFSEDFMLTVYNQEVCWRIIGAPINDISEIEALIELASMKNDEYGEGPDATDEDQVASISILQAIDKGFASMIDDNDINVICWKDTLAVVKSDNKDLYEKITQQ